jgi:hypothetical protein
MVNSIVMFWPDGDNKKMPKRSQPKIAKVIAIKSSKDGKIRRTKISYANASQMQMDSWLAVRLKRLPDKPVQSFET